MESPPVKGSSSAQQVGPSIEPPEQRSADSKHDSGPRGLDLALQIAGDKTRAHDVVLARDGKSVPQGQSVVEISPTQALTSQLIGGAADVDATASTSDAPDATRLSRNVSPTAYHVELDASPNRADFSGKVTIESDVAATTNDVTLHTRALEVSDVVAIVGGRRITGHAEVDPEREVCLLTFDEPLPAGPVSLSMRYAGELSSNMRGLYLGEDGNERAIVSQAEATDARAMFPCFDEPDFKASLRWTVTTDPNLTVITNGRRVSSEPTGDGKVRHEFAATRRMSTYLAAVTIGRLDATETKNIGGVESRILVGPGKTDQASFAEEVTARVVPWYEEYFGQKYPFKKLEQVAVPGFDAGAMENVGAIFYRQKYLLMDPKNSSWQARKDIGEVVAHEIAHQWFGNLVTMKWWDDLWLNEAFATWVSFKACDLWHPEWRMWDDFMSLKQAAFEADSLVNTHAIYTPIDSPAEATELFDAITYEKGCAVMRMCEGFVGADLFRDGIRDYMRTFKGGNAEGRDLWNAITKAANQPVDAIMKSWVNQEGHPLIGVDLRNDGGKATLRLNQKRYFADVERMRESTDQTWQVPITVRYEDDEGVKTHTLLLTDRRQSFELPAKGAVRWAYPNGDATGFYRLQLGDEGLDALLNAGVQHLTAAERTSLIQDQWSLVENGTVHVERFMDVLAAFKGEEDHIVIEAVAARLHDLDERLVSDTDRDKLAGFVRWMLEPQLDELGWEARDGETPPVAVRRATVVEVLGSVGRSEAVLDRAEALAQREAADSTAVEPNLAGVVVKLSALRADESRLQNFVDTYLQRKRDGASPELQKRHFAAMSSVEAWPLAEKVLRLCMDDTVPQEKIGSVLSDFIESRPVQRQAWDFIKANWESLGPRVGAMGISYVVESCGRLPADLEDDVRQFFAAHPVEEATRALEQAFETMHLRQSLVEREASNLGRWLEASAAV